MPKTWRKCEHCRDTILLIDFDAKEPFVCPFHKDAGSVPCPEHLVPKHVFGAKKTFKLLFWNLQHAGAATAEKTAILMKLVGLCDLACLCELNPDFLKLMPQWLKKGTIKGHGFLSIPDKNENKSMLNLCVLTTVTGLVDINAKGEIPIETVALDVRSASDRSINLKRPLARVATSLGDVFFIHSPAREKPAEYTRLAIAKHMKGEFERADGYKAIAIGDMNCELTQFHLVQARRGRTIVNIGCVSPGMTETHHTTSKLSNTSIIDYLVNCGASVTATPYVEGFKGWAGDPFSDHLPILYDVG